MFRRLVLVKWQTHYIITWSHLIFLSIVCFELIKDNDLSLVQISWGFGVLRFPIFDERKASETEVSAGLSQEFLIVNSFKGRFGEKQTSTRPFFVVVVVVVLLLFVVGVFLCVCVCFVVVVFFWGGRWWPRLSSDKSSGTMLKIWNASYWDCFSLLNCGQSLSDSNCSR